MSERDTASNDDLAVTDEVIRLPDGRRLCYCDAGDPGGTPVMLFHGAPGYRRYWQALPDFPFLPGLRLIAPDRPGYGRSDVRRDLTYASWPDDVAALADRLELDRFAVLGVSGGGPGALACAWRFPDRLSGVAVVSSMGPPEPEILAEISRTNRIVYRVARRAPWLMRLNMKLIAALERHDLDRYLDLASGKLSASDRAALSRPAVREALRVTMSAEAVPRHAVGYAQDVINQSRPWPFPLSEVPCLVHVWQPEDDTSTPPVIGRHFDRVLPHSRVHYIPGAGHLWHIEQLSTVLRALVE